MSGVQLVEQRLGFLQVESVESFGEPTIDRSEKIVGLISLSLIAPEPRYANRRAQLKTPGLLPLRGRYGREERFLDRCNIVQIALE